LDGGPPGHLREAARPWPAHPDGDAGDRSSRRGRAARSIGRPREDGDRDGAARPGRGGGPRPPGGGRRSEWKGRRGAGRAVKVVGMIAGTSLDGIDAALVELDGRGEMDVRWAVHSFLTVPYTPEQRAEIHDAIVKGGAA